MKSPAKITEAPSRSPSLAVLLGLLAAGLAARGLHLPVPAVLAALVLALLGLRLGVMAAAIVEPPRAPSAPPSGAHAGEPALRAANG